MSIRYNNVKLASANTYHPDLFDVKWSDHILDNISWLRADTFSWHYGELYTRAYQHLTKDITNKILQSEIVAGITIQYYLANDGHKICPDTEEENIQDLYEETGIAWYYIIDTTNHRFKLPRTKYAFTGVRNNVGKFVEAGLPNITGSLQSRGYGDNTYYGAITEGDEAFEVQKGSSATTLLYSGTVHANGDSKPDLIQFDASKSNEIYGNSLTVQPQATEMYLYFYIGNFAQKDITATYGPEFMAHQAMPSDKYIELTLGAIHTEYVAPADGYFNIKWLGYINSWFWMGNTTNTLFNVRTDCNYPDGGMLETFLPVRKNETIQIIYTNLRAASDIQDPDQKTFRFVYAEGSK